MTTGINTRGALTGFYWYEGSRYKGYLRTAGGKFVKFDPPDSRYTQPLAINDSGVIAGWYSDRHGTHGFIRTP